MANDNNDLEEGSCGSSPSASCSFYNDDASMMSLEGGTKMNSFSRRSYSSKTGYINPADVASKEQKAVIFSRFVVATVLVIALATVSFTMFWVVGRNERREFEIQFATFVSETSALVQDNCKSTIDSAEAFSTAITSYAIATNSSWPYVTIEDFTSKAKRLASLSGAYQIGFAPIVYPEQLSGWPVHSYLNLPSYYEEVIEVHGLNTTVDTMVKQTLPFVWHPNASTNAPDMTDPQEPDMPETVKNLRENVGFNGYFVNWQSLEPITALYNRCMAVTNLNLLYGGFENALRTSYEFKIPAFDSWNKPVHDPNTMEFIGYESQTQMVQPIFDTIYNGHRKRKELKMVGALIMLFDWTSLLSDLISNHDIRDIDIVLSSSCSSMQPISFRVNEADVVQLGLGDLHDPQYDDMEFTTSLFELQLDHDTQVAVDKRIANEGTTDSTVGGCVSEIVMSIYPTNKLEQSFRTNLEWTLSGWVAAAFLFTSLVFFGYDIMVRRRQKKIMDRIIRQEKIVSMTFPKVIRDNLFRDSNHTRTSHTKNMEWDEFDDSVRSISSNPILRSKRQIAELYPSATVVFADIVGFTAWSSAREPNQVFKLLETIYKEFDKIASRNNVFKVETVGDCYVAAAGVPEKCEGHAVAVATFSRECMQKLPGLVEKLEIHLGPGTADLQLRIGIHTGQVTAGVLRGDKARFQLFGDTVNTASRMETTSKPGCIQISAATADALITAGYKRWLKPREDTVHAKGKGHMETYFLKTIETPMVLERYKSIRTIETCSVIAEEESTSETLAETEETIPEVVLLDQAEDFDIMSKSDRLIEWNVEILSYLLKQILVARPGNLRDVKTSVLTEFEGSNKYGVECSQKTALDEFKEIIELPIIEDLDIMRRKHPNTIILKPIVVEQLRDLIQNIASMYNENAFHNFEHASHVTASVRKLLTRIVDADNCEPIAFNKDGRPQLIDLSGHSYGISSDPLTQFAVVFSALIHDADHPGVPNNQLVKENTRLAKIYQKSIAEQNSVELIWEILMSDCYKDLRSCIYSTEQELRRFRQLVVNTVMATDIADKELQRLRKMRWEDAFSQKRKNEPQLLNLNRKATIVIEHLIQASDVSHTMQHWNIYKKWNEKFFFEQYDAYRNGRAEVDPSINWYKGEIGFFDFYVIPLAKKLESCGVFGVSSHEYLGYAESNREEWVREGKQVVKEYLENYRRNNEQ